MAESKQENTPQPSNERISNLSLLVQSYKGKIKKALTLFYSKKGLLKFILLNIVLFVLIVSSAYVYFTQRDLKIKKLVARNQALYINIISGEIFTGKLYSAKPIVEEKKEEEEPFAPKENKEVYIKQYLNEEALKKNKIVILVAGLGLSKSSTDEALTLPNNFTLGFSPYTGDIANWIYSVHSKGFEIMLNLPLQPLDYQMNDPGPLAMLDNISTADNMRRLQQIILKSPYIKGFYTLDNESFSSSRSNFMPIVEELQKKNLFMVFGNPDNYQMIKSINESSSSEIKQIDIVLDKDLDDMKIQDNLRRLEQIAKLKGSVIAVMRAYPISIKNIKKWLDELDEKKYSIVPISVLYSKKYKEVVKKSEETNLLKD